MTFLNLSKTKWEEQSSSKYVSFFVGLFVVLNLTTTVARAQSSHRQKVKILPLVSFYSTMGEGEVYNWWAENDSLGEMKIFSDHLNKSLEQTTLSKWEYIPFKELQKDPDSSYQFGGLSLEEKREFAKLKGAGLVLAGDFRIQPSPLYDKGVRISQKLELLRAKNGEIVGETLRITDLPRHEYAKLILMGSSTNKDFFEGAIASLHEKIENYKSLEKPVLDTKLVLMGRLSDQQIEKMKDKIQKQTLGLQSIRTMSLERDQVVLLVQGVTGEKLSQALSQIPWKDYRTQVVSTDAKQVVFDVRDKNGVN